MVFGDTMLPRKSEEAEEGEVGVLLNELEEDKEVGTGGVELPLLLWLDAFTNIIFLSSYTMPSGTCLRRKYFPFSSNTIPCVDDLSAITSLLTNIMLISFILLFYFQIRQSQITHQNRKKKHSDEKG
jgi:hypothetical protein